MVQRFFKFFLKLSFIGASILSCSSDPLKNISPLLFSKLKTGGYPPSIKLNRYAGDSLKVTIDGSSYLYMQFQEEQEKTYEIRVKSVLIPGIQISQVAFKNLDATIKEESQFHFDLDKQVGSFTWKPSSSFTGGSL